MSHLASIIDSDSSLAPQAVFTAVLPVNAINAVLVGTTAANFGRFVVTDVWWSANTSANSGFTLSCGVVGTTYVDICAAQAITTPSATRNFNKLTLVATTAVNGPTVAPSTGIYVRCSTSTNTGTVQIHVAGYYIGARTP
jgi:hypothetical protein